MSKAMADVDIAVIGTGIGGLSFAVGLKKQLPKVSFVLFEKASEVGGTWRDNIYPGCSSDVRIHLYSLSSEQKPDWAETHGSSNHILSYWKSIAQKHHLYPHIRFNTLVVTAEWSVSEQLWTVQTENERTGERIRVKAKVLISAIGTLECPNTPDIPGLESFGGKHWHSARWRTDVDLRGKKVAVIGNGSSAAQFIPEITKDERVEVTQFCRSPKWYWNTQSTTRGPIPERQKWLFKYIPSALSIYRSYFFLMNEVFWILISYLKKQTANTIATYMKATAPEKYHSMIIPTFPVGCKRIIFDNGYLDSLHRPNLELSADRIECVTKRGIVTATGGEIAIDVIIMATGFITHTYPIAIRGVDGKTVQEYYDSRSGAEAYRGTALPGFPNFFMLLGPNVATGHSSALFTIEVQTEYILQLLSPLFPLVPTSTSRTHHRRSSSDVPLIPTELTSIAPSHESTNAYNIYLQKWLQKSIWVACSSWYRQDSGKVISVFPGPMILFWWYLRSPNWFEFEGWNRTGERVDGDSVRAWIQEVNGMKRWQVWKVVFGLAGFTLATIAGWLWVVWTSGGFDHTR